MTSASSASASSSAEPIFWPTEASSAERSSSASAQPYSGNEDEDDHEHEHQDAKDELSKAMDSVVQIHCTHSEPDYLIPWQRQHQSTSTSSGFAIALLSSDDAKTGDSDNNNKKELRVMTNAHSVEYGTLVQVQRRGDGRKYEAKVEAFANECDLAILKIDSPRFWQGLVPLPISPTLPSLQDEVQVLGYPTGGTSLSITSGVVSRIEMQEYAQASSHLLAIQIDAAINAGNSGGPVMSENMQVIGVAFQGLDHAENIGYVVPVTVMQHILQDIKRNGRYCGFCSLGIGSALLENKAFRKSLGMVVHDEHEQEQEGQDQEQQEEEQTGVLVKSVSPIAPSHGILKPGDVLCKIDGIPVANDGKIPFRHGERVAASCYTQTKFVGDTVKLQIWRNRQQLDLDVPVGISHKLVPTHWNNRPPPYLVVAGMVFTVLSVPYLYASEAWESYVSDEMSYLLGKWHESLKRPNDQVVVLAQVLAHRENLGYDQLSDLHLEKLNGKEVRSLVHLKEMLDQETAADVDESSSSSPYLRFEFGPPNHNIVVLERATLNRVTQEVCEEQFIPHVYHLHDYNDRPAEEGEGQVEETKTRMAATTPATSTATKDDKFVASNAATTTTTTTTTTTRRSNGHDSRGEPPMAAPRMTPVTTGDDNEKLEGREEVNGSNGGMDSAQQQQ